MTQTQHQMITVEPKTQLNSITNLTALTDFNLDENIYCDKWISGTNIWTNKDKNIDNDSQLYSFYSIDNSDNILTSNIRVYPISKNGKTTYFEDKDCDIFLACLQLRIKKNMNPFETTIREIMAEMKPAKLAGTYYKRIHEGLEKLHRIQIQQSGRFYFEHGSMGYKSKCITPITYELYDAVYRDKLREVIKITINEKSDSELLSPNRTSMKKSAYFNMTKLQEKSFFRVVSTYKSDPRYSKNHVSLPITHTLNNISSSKVNAERRYQKSALKKYAQKLQSKEEISKFTFTTTKVNDEKVGWINLYFQKERSMGGNLSYEEQAKCLYDFYLAEFNIDLKKMKNFSIDNLVKMMKKYDHKLEYRGSVYHRVIFTLDVILRQKMLKNVDIFGAKGISNLNTSMKVFWENPNKEIQHDIDFLPIDKLHINSKRAKLEAAEKAKMVCKTESEEKAIFKQFIYLKENKRKYVRFEKIALERLLEQGNLPDESSPTNIIGRNAMIKTAIKSLIREKIRKGERI